ncbi:selenium metabolism membrane protein YedE/FdhT [Alcaligenaceae bacterium]|nr:selenium metabolism membrane protein YedE/FdhT [Alcaligenaceae bacterium]
MRSRIPFLHYWHPLTALIVAGVLSAAYFGLTGTVWAVTGEFTRLGGQLLHLMGIDTTGWAYYNIVKLDGNTLLRGDGWIVWGMFTGALIMVLLNDNFKIRLPQLRRRWAQALVGGIVAGFGARMAMGCNLAAFFTGVPQFSVHAWVFIVGTGIGSFFGTRLITLRWWKGRPTLLKGKGSPSTRPSRRIQPVVGVLLAVAYVSVVVYFFASGQNRLGLGALFGALFGVLIERGQICFTSAFRDLWMMGRAVMAKAIIAGMAISAVATIAIIVVFGTSPITQVVAPSTFVGGVLFGVGIVMASSCETGMMYRLMEGQLMYVAVFAGNIIGATLLAYAWDHLGIYDALVASGAKVNLYNYTGAWGAITITLLLLGLFYAYVAFRQSRQTASRTTSPRSSALGAQDYAS